VEKESHYLRHHELRIDATFLPHITQNNKFRVFGCRCCWLLAQRFCESPKQWQQKALFKTSSRILQDKCSVHTVTCAWAVWQRQSRASTVSVLSRSLLAQGMWVHTFDLSPALPASTDESVPRASTDLWRRCPAVLPAAGSQRSTIIWTTTRGHIDLT